MDTGRTCEECTACCKPFKIPEIDKLTATWCDFRIECKGCAIYDSRPLAYQLFRCLWLDGQGLLGDRPDKLGVIMESHVVDVFGRVIEVLEMMEVDAGSLEKPRVQEIIEHVARLGIVVIARRLLSDTLTQSEMIVLPGLLNEDERTELRRAFKS